MRQQATCVICGGPLWRRSKEDVIPKWLQEYQQLGGLPALPTIIGPLGTSGDVIADGPVPEYVIKKVDRDLPVKRVLLRGVCRTACNNGWMNDLESKVSPIIHSLLEEKSFSGLTPDQGNILARWLLKTAFTSEAFQPADRVMVPVEHLMAVRKGLLPVGISVFGSVLPVVGKPFLMLLNREWPVISPGVASIAAIDEYVRSTYKFTFRVRDIALTLSYTPVSPPWGLATWPGVHHPVFDSGVPTQPIEWGLSRPQEFADHEAHFALGLSHGAFDHRPAFNFREYQTGPQLYEHEEAFFHCLKGFLTGLGEVNPLPTK